MLVLVFYRVKEFMPICFKFCVSYIMSAVREIVQARRSYACSLACTYFWAWEPNKVCKHLYRNVHTTAYTWTHHDRVSYYNQGPAWDQSLLNGFSPQVLVILDPESVWPCYLFGSDLLLDYPCLSRFATFVFKLSLDSWLGFCLIILCPVACIL